ncbi:LIPA1-like protein [Mya arenaria]|uniref:LIPA1-like protein n=1 Tax=Mya arenaria TaxID=6604 RepID=A0ABY7DVZ8_MYAAR|nr:LIPA1-like protein [Mya arenaria]
MANGYNVQVDLRLFGVDYVVARVMGNGKYVERCVKELASLTKELNCVREALHEREEEVTELKAERNNTRVRERLRVALERLFTLREQQTKSRHSSGSTEDGRHANKVDTTSPSPGSDHVLEKDHHPKRLSNGSIDPDSDVNRVIELQETVEKQNSELTNTRTKMLEMNNKLTELDESYTTGQKDLIKAQEQVVKLQRDLRELEEKIRGLQERIEVLENKLAATQQQAKALPTVEAQLAQRMEALTEAEQRHGSIEERIQQLEDKVSEKESELHRMNEEHNARLSATVDKLLTESNERLQLHLKEKMQALEEKNQLTQELERTRKALDDAQQEKERMLEDLQRAKREVDTLRQQIEHLAGQGDGYQVQFGSPDESVTRRSQRGRESLDDPDKHAFDTSDEGSEGNESLIGAFDMLSPSGHTDAQTLALMLQEQLDAINNEIRLIQEEKETTEQRAEELESRVGSGSLEALAGRWPPSPIRSHPPSPNESSGLPLDAPNPAPAPTQPTGLPISSCATAQPASAVPAHLYTYSSSSPQLASTATDERPQQQYSRDDASIKDDSLPIHCESSPPNTPRSLRLERIQNALSQSTDSYANTASSQDSLNRSQKKKGLKSSIRTLFGKKEKPKHKGSMSRDSQQGPGYIDAGGDNTDTLGRGLGPSEFDKRKKRKEELLEEAMKACTPFALWNGPTVVAWLEEIQREIGISNPLHRLKLRLAIQEMQSLAFGDMNHEWIGNEWLPGLGLPQYRSHFMECLVDARMLDHLTKKDLRGQLKMVDNFHRTSLQYGINSLKRLNYDKKELESRREKSLEENTDSGRFRQVIKALLVNHRFRQVIKALLVNHRFRQVIKAQLVNQRFRQVIKALLVNHRFRQIFKALLVNQRFRQGEGGRFRRAPSWRKKFRNKDRSKDGGEDGEGSEAGAQGSSPQVQRRMTGPGLAGQLQMTETMRNF